MRSALIRGLVFVTGALPSPAELQAQGVLRGRVVDESGQPLSYANVQINEGRRFVSDDSGRFQLPYALSGTATLVVRRIGFRPAEVALRAMPDTALLVQMSAIPRELKGVVITGGSAFPSLDTYGFYRRMEDSNRGINRGYFVTPEDIDRRKPISITQMAEGYPTVRVMRGRRPMNDVISGSQGCRMTVYLDNIRLRGDDFVNELVQPSHVAAMEIYPREVAAPPQFRPPPHARSGMCGVVLIWTK